MLLGLAPPAALAQWLDYPTPGIPRTADGAPDLKAAAPRTSAGKPDFSGMWFANVPSRDYCRTADCIQEERMAREQINMGIKMKDGLPYTQWSKDQMVPRRANGGREDPHTYCMPPNFPRAWTLRVRNFPTIAYARTIKDSGGKALFTGITQIYEPESASADPK